MINRIDLGAGKDPVPGCYTVDYNPDNEPDMVANLDDPQVYGELPQHHYKEVHMHHVLEHLDNWQDALDGIARILHPDGSAHITVPHYSNSVRWPDHDNHFSYAAFDQLFDPGHSMHLGTGLVLVEKQLRYCVARRTLKGRLGRMLNPVVDSRLAPYFDMYLWPFVGGIQEVYVRLEHAD
jgi:SAM-dependent methyltransferase